ncbi:UNVERIFIED_CONTAM: hypothetical protein FKN15_071068 [Acipenser sinensis]
MNPRCPPKHVPSATHFFTPCSHLRATASEDNAALGSLQASPQAPGQTTGVAGVRSAEDTLADLSPPCPQFTVGNGIAWTRTGDIQAIGRILHST